MNKQEQRTFGITENLLKKPVPKFYGAGKHKVQLAYITPAEAELLADLDLHDSNPPNPGPGGIPNFNDPGTGMSGAQASAAERSPRDRTRREQRDLAVGSSFGPSFGGGQGPSGQPGFTQADVAAITAGAQAAAQGQAASQAFQDAQRATAQVSAAPEVVEETPTQNTNSFLNFFNNRILNPIVDSYYNLTPLTYGGLTPTEFGLLSLYGNMFNFNPTKDEETGEISTSLLGDLGTATFGKLNFENYKDYKGLANPQDFYDAAFDFDDEGNFEGTNFEALQTYTDNMGMVLKEGKDLEQNLKDRMDTNKDGKIDGFDFAGDGGPADVYIPPSTNTTSGAAASGTGTGTATVDTTDYQSIYNNFSADQKATADKIIAMDDYDLPYAVDYVRMGGPLF